MSVNLYLFKFKFGLTPQLRCAAFFIVLLNLCGLAQAVDGAQDPDTLKQQHLLALIREEASAYEHGEGVERDGTRAAALYCKAARMGDAQAQYNLGWMYSNGSAVPRNDNTAAFFFHAAAEQGWPQAIRMLETVGGRSSETPDCMKALVAPKATVLTAAGSAAPNSLALRSIIKAPLHIADIVKQVATEQQVEPQLVLAIIEAESNFNVGALSPKNAQGLMQLIPETAARFHVSRPFDATQNIRGGTAYLRWLLAYFEGDVALVAAAYNAGEGAVNRYKGVPPYAETMAYVSRILKRVGTTALPFDRSVSRPSPQLRSMRAETSSLSLRAALR
jgi:soluble lytic murein transglycosylase-like protein